MYYNLHRTMKKKPPDKYKCIKVPLQSILHKDDDNSINIFNRILIELTYFIMFSKKKNNIRK